MVRRIFLFSLLVSLIVFPVAASALDVGSAFYVVTYVEKTKLRRTAKAIQFFMHTYKVRVFDGKVLASSSEWVNFSGGTPYGDRVKGYSTKVPQLTKAGNPYIGPAQKFLRPSLHAILLAELAVLGWETKEITSSVAEAAKLYRENEDLPIPDFTLNLYAPEFWQRCAASVAVITDQSHGALDPNFLLHLGTMLPRACCDRFGIANCAIKRDGDANRDGKVDLTDFLHLSRNWGKSGASWSSGDFDGDGTVGYGDLLILQDNMEP